MEMIEIPKPKPGNQQWGIYFTDREYARVMGDPLRAVIEAPTKIAAEEAASRLGLSDAWAHPVTPEQAKQIRGPATRSPGQPHQTMLTPTTIELFTAIEVLKKLGLRINEHAAHSVTQLPATELGETYAAHIKDQSIEQTGHIEIVKTQLQNWRDELQQQRRQHVSQTV
jgi:hypothetical protein